MRKEEIINGLRTLRGELANNYKDNQRIGFIAGVNRAIEFIHSTDEPEVLSQEKVQIPWFVYKWIEHQKMFDFTIYDLLSLASKGKWATESMNKFINENGELFIKAWLAYPDIEVEEEQKYYVVKSEGLDGVHYYFAKFDDEMTGLFTLPNDKKGAYRFDDKEKAQAIANYTDSKVEELEE